MSTLSKDLKDSLNNLEDFKPEQLDSLVREAVNAFHSIQEKAKSTDPKDVEKAMETALDLKSSLESQLKSMMETLGIDMEELSTFMSDPSNFSPEEQKLMKAIDEEFKQAFPDKEEAPVVAKTPKKRKKTTPWIAG